VTEDGERNHVDGGGLAAAALSGGHEKRGPLGKQQRFEDRKGAGDNNAPASVIAGEVTKPFMRQVSHRLGDRRGGALCWLGEDCLQFRRYAEDDAAITIQPSPGEQRSVGQHKRQRGDAGRDRQRVAGARQVMFDEGGGQVNGPTRRGIDVLDVSLDQLGKRDLVEPGQKRLFRRRQPRFIGLPLV
jgi:hypothetical protein